MEQAGKQEEYNVSGLLRGSESGEENFRILQETWRQFIAGGCAVFVLPEGEYAVYNEKARSLYDRLLRGGLSGKEFARCVKEGNILFQGKGKSHIQIRGQNTVLNFRGLMQPFDFGECDGITIQGITVDWQNPPWFVARVAAKGGDRIIIEPEPGSGICGGEPVVSVQNIDPLTGRQGGMALFEGIGCLQTLNDGRFWFTCTEPGRIAVGETLILRHLYNFASPLHFYRCRDIRLQDVTVMAAPGMGLIAHKCENISLERFSVKPSGNRRMSTNCDATHFIGCSGKIKITDSYFEGMGDDAVNVHGFYLTVHEIRGRRVYFSQDADSQDAVPYLPDAGHAVVFLDVRTLLPYAQTQATITRVGFDPENGLPYIELDGAVPACVRPGDCFADMHDIAGLTVESCTVRNIRGRGMLIQTKGARVANCTFDGCTGQGIHICTEAGWWESIGAEDVDIAGNRFIHCGFGRTKYCDAVAVAVTTNAEIQKAGVHRGIVIRDNEICGENNTAILLTCVSGVRISGNHMAASCADIVVRDAEDVAIV